VSQVLTLTLKDLRRRLADPAALLVNLAIPLAIAGAMILAFGDIGGGGDSGPAAPKLRLGVVNLDEGFVSELLAGATQNSEAARHMEVRQEPDRESGLKLLRDQEFSALLVIPKGFGSSVLNGRKTSLELIKNPAQSIMPVVAQQITEVGALYASGAAKLLGDAGPRVSAIAESGGWQNAQDIGALAASLAIRFRGVDELMLPPLIEIDETKQDEPAAGASGEFDLISWMFPGMIVMGMIFVGMSQMKDLLRERDAGTMRRQLAGPVGPGTLLISKVLSVGVVVTAACGILMAIGAGAMGIRWGPLLPLAASTSALVLAVTGFSALMFSMVRTERQGDALGGIVTMVMSLLGGAFVPVQIMPAWMLNIARLTVNYWGNETLRALTGGGGWAEVAPYLGVLAVLGLVMTSLGVLLLRRRHLRGAL